MRALLLGLCALVIGCAAPAPPQDVWVWRRQWTPALSAAVADAPRVLERLRILAVEDELTPGGRRRIFVRVDEGALVAARRPVLATWRIAGSAPPDDAAASELVELLARWRAAGVDVVGLEVDHDCATARLARYRDFLVGLRATLPPGLDLAITALPTWRTDPVALRSLGAVVDELTVQLHAVHAPTLFDPDRAVEEAAAFSRAAGRDVSVALPTYAARTRRGPLLRVEAADLNRAARALRRTAGVTRLAYFRLGAADDPGAFAADTLASIARGVAVDARAQAGLVVQEVPARDGAVDLYLVNQGATPAPPPARVPFPWPAQLFEAAPGMHAEGGAFIPAVETVPAGARLRLGWLRRAQAGAGAPQGAP